MGVAFSDQPEGPFEKHQGNPILDKSHEVLIWREETGVGCLASISSSFEYAEDGMDFSSMPLAVPIDRPTRPNAPGAYRIDLVQRNAKTSGLTWGISMVHNHDEAYLIRFELKNDNVN
jgi:hypothetical protein